MPQKVTELPPTAPRNPTAKYTLRYKNILNISEISWQEKQGFEKQVAKKLFLLFYFHECL